MRFVYFTKMLQGLDVPGLIRFCKEVGLDGVDLAVRPGYPVNPENVRAELPKANKAFQDENLLVGLVTAATDLLDPSAPKVRDLFEACGQCGVAAIKIGYFPYRRPFDESLADAQRRLEGIAKLAERTGVRACYHTHSGSYLGNNAAGARLLLSRFDPHHVGVFFDTGHTAVNGGPVRMELDIVRPWLSLIAIKDMAWRRDQGIWNYHVVPAGDGVVRWDEFAKGVTEARFNGTISLHGEYEAKDLEERKRLATAEVLFLKAKLST